MGGRTGGRERETGRHVVHFEIIGIDPGGLRGFYGELFGWTFQMGDAASEKVSRPGASPIPRAM